MAEELWAPAWDPAQRGVARCDGDGAQAVLPRVLEDSPHEAAVREADCQSQEVNISWDKVFAIETVITANAKFANDDYLQ